MGKKIRYPRPAELPPETSITKIIVRTIAPKESTIVNQFEAPGLAGREGSVGISTVSDGRGVCILGGRLNGIRYLLIIASN
jgi:hypothetical protein